MASLADRLKKFLRGPTGQRAIRKAVEIAQDPKTQRKMREFLDKRRKR